MDERGRRRDYVRREHAVKVAHVRRLCRRIEAGETITEACRDPTMPPRSTLVFWLARHDELRALVEDAEAAAEAVFGPRRRAYHRWDPELAEELLARIADGRGLREVCAEADMPAACSVTRWLNERPEFAEAYRRAREEQADVLFDLAWRIACEATEETVRTSKLKIETLKWRVGKLVPRKYGPLKAQAPEAAAGEGAAAKEGKRVKFELRRWARTPQGEVVEITKAVRGLDEAAIAEVDRSVREGRWRPGPEDGYGDQASAGG